MAKHNGIAQTPLRFNDQDMAVAAQRRVKAAGADDEAYNSAAAALETATATTPAGVKALFELYSSRVESSMLEGDQVQSETMVALARNILAGLDHLIRKAG
jgi:hypothetical protein